MYTPVSVTARHGMVCRTAGHRSRTTSASLACSRIRTSLTAAVGAGTSKIPGAVRAVQRQVRLHAVPPGSTYCSVAAEETMARICSASQWTGSSTEPPGCVAEACSLLAFPARHQQSSSAASTAVQAVQQRPAAGSLQEQVQEQGRFAGAVSDKRLQQLLVALLGDLDKTWEDQQLFALLLQLPPYGLKLLLSSDDLTATSEDTVWLTVQQYIESHLATTAEQHNRSVLDFDQSYVQALHEELYCLVRMPQLSPYCLSCVVAVLESAAEATGCEEYALLAGRAQQLVGLQLQHGDRLSGLYLQRLVKSGAPDSWLLPARKSAASTSV